MSCEAGQKLPGSHLLRGAGCQGAGTAPSQALLAAAAAAAATPGVSVLVVTGGPVLQLSSKRDPGACGQLAPFLHANAPGHAPLCLATLRPPWGWAARAARVSRPLHVG